MSGQLLSFLEEYGKPPALPTPPRLYGERVERRRPRWWSRLARWVARSAPYAWDHILDNLHTIAQLGGAGLALTGLHMLLGTGVTLLIAGILLAALGTVRELKIIRSRVAADRE